MKKFALLALTFATVALFTKPVFANHEHSHEKDAQVEAIESADNRNTYEGMMQYSLKNMQSQMAEIHQTGDPQKRLTLLQEHNKSMRDSMKMLREMMGGMAMENAMESGHKAGDHCDHKKGENMSGGHKMCDHKKSDHSAHHHDGNADAAPVAHSNLDQIIATDKTPTSSAKKLWVCPMHPEITQDHPGVCPKCGMDLVEMEQPGASQPEHSHMMMGSSMKCNNMKGSKKGDCKKSGSMKCRDKKGDGMKCQMADMMEKRMDMMLMLMEQMLEHNEAEMAAPK